MNGLDRPEGRSAAGSGLTSADWAGAVSQEWSAHADQLEAMLAPVDEILVPAARIEGGERVLDVGCGRGVTTRAAAAAAGPDGAVTGVDISATLIAEASAAPVPAGSAPITWVTADASAHRFPSEHHDVVLSRFGAIFFDDPVAAFANLRTTTRHSGRVVLAVWQPQNASEFQSLSIDIAVRVAADHGVELEPTAPDAGPFAYGKADYVTGMLEQAGWTHIDFVPHELMLYVGGPGTTPERAVEMGLGFGALATLLRDAPTAVTEDVAAALTDELEARWDGTGAPLRAAIAIVSARPT